MLTLMMLRMSELIVKGYMCDEVALFTLMISLLVFVFDCGTCLVIVCLFGCFLLCDCFSVLLSMKLTMYFLLYFR